MTAVPPEVGRALAAFGSGQAVLRAAPAVVPLAGGLTNRAWRVTAGDVDWVVRVGGTRDAQLGIDRRAELQALRAAAAHGLAPSCVHAAPARGVLVLEHVPGTVWSRDAARAPDGIDRIGRLFAALHAVPPPAELRDVEPSAAIARLLGVPPAGSAPVSRERLAVRSRAALAAVPRGARVLCHHDVHHRNVVDAGRLVLLDWEYAGVGDPAMDLAAYASYHDLEGPKRARLLAAYGPGVPRPALDGACAVFDCLQALWHDAAGTWDALPAASREALVARLTGPRTEPMDSR